MRNCCAVRGPAARPALTKPFVDEALSALMAHDRAAMIDARYSAYGGGRSDGPRAGGPAVACRRRA